MAYALCETPGETPEAGIPTHLLRRGSADSSRWHHERQFNGLDTPIWSRYQRRSVDRRLIPCPFPWRRAFNPLNCVVDGWLCVSPCTHLVRALNASECFCDVRSAELHIRKP